MVRRKVLLGRADSLFRSSGPMRDAGSVIAGNASQRTAGLFASSTGPLGATKTQILPNVPGEMVFDFDMSGHRLFLAGLWVEVDVLARP